MTCRDTITCFHEPFGDAFYYGPERISPAWLGWPADKIEKTGRSHFTYDFVLQTISDADKDPSKRIFLKDITYHILPPSHSALTAAPSLKHLVKPNDPPNPTLLPTWLLSAFHFVFLIRNPSASIPSLYRCTIPPLSAKTGEHVFDPRELGYRETRILLDYLYPPATRSLAHPETFPVLIDADDLLRNPSGILRALCRRVGLPCRESMLNWDSPEDYAHAKALFEKYYGYHEDALESTGLRSKTADLEAREREGRGTARTRREEDDDWRERYGDEAARRIREAVDGCRSDYEYLRELRLKAEDK